MTKARAKKTIASEFKLTQSEAENLITLTKSYAAACESLASLYTVKKANEIAKQQQEARKTSSNKNSDEDIGAVVFVFLVMTSGFLFWKGYFWWGVLTGILAFGVALIAGNAGSDSSKTFQPFGQLLSAYQNTKKRTHDLYETLQAYGLFDEDAGFHPDNVITRSLEILHQNKQLGQADLVATGRRAQEYMTSKGIR